MPVSAMTTGSRLSKANCAPSSFSVRWDYNKSTFPRSQKSRDVPVQTSQLRLVSAMSLLLSLRRTSQVSSINRKLNFKDYWNIYVFIQQIKSFYWMSCQLSLWVTTTSSRRTTDRLHEPARLRIKFWSRMMTASSMICQTTFQRNERTLHWWSLSPRERQSR
jgi:hypothetical protein